MTKTLLPLLELRPDIVWREGTFAEGYLLGQKEQRESDIRLIKPLVDALVIIAENGSYQGNMYSIPVKVWMIAQAVL